MSSEKPDQLIDFSHAKEPPLSLNLDKVEQDTGGVYENHRPEEETPEEDKNQNIAERQTNIANIPGANILLGDRTD